MLDEGEGTDNGGVISRVEEGREGGKEKEWLRALLTTDTSGYAPAAK